MIKKIIDILKSNLSFFVILLGAISFFFTNIILKNVFSSYNYGYYSIFITYFSGAYLIGIFGLEQGFLRYSHTVRKNIIATHKIQIKLITIITLSNTIIFSLLFFSFYSQMNINKILFIIATLAMILMLFLFNIFRLNSNFVISQLYSNYWKYLTFILALFFLITKSNNIELFFKIILLNIIIITLIAIVHLKKQIEFIFINEINKRDIFISAIHYSLSILAFTILIFSDRFIIEKKHSIEILGNYFYLTNFFLAPFSILQNYIGFKQLIKFKNEFNKKDFKKFNTQVIFFGMFLSAFLSVISYIGDYYKIFFMDFENNIVLIILLLTTGIVRIYTASILSAFEAKANNNMLRFSNIIILTITVTIIVFIMFCVEKIEIIISLYILIWYFRGLVHKKILMSQNNETL